MIITPKWMMILNAIFQDNTIRKTEEIGNIKVIEDIINNIIPSGEDVLEFNDCIE